MPFLWVIGHKIDHIARFGVAQGDFKDVLCLKSGNL
jgi:hypothetical protein